MPERGRTSARASRARLTRQLPRAPLIEAVCEFRFLADAPWDWTIPGLMWEKVRKEFPEKQSKSLVSESAFPVAGLPTELRRGVSRTQFLAPGGSPLLQLGPDLLAVNVLRPYPGWRAFRALILRQLAIYREVAGPAGFERIGLRYINRVEIPATEIDLGLYFQVAPAYPPGQDLTITGFLSVADLAPPDSSIGLRFVLGSAQDDRPEISAFSCDLDASIQPKAPMASRLVASRLDDLHAIIEKTFEATFTDRARHDLFGRDGE